MKTAGQIAYEAECADFPNYIDKKQYDRLAALLEERQLLKARHANTPIGCYSLKQKLLILADRKAAINHLTTQIEAICQQAG